MAPERTALSERVLERIRVFEAEVREILYGEAGCPELGTRFTKIEAVAMSVGEEVSRRFMASAVGRQAEGIPREALEALGEPALHQPSQPRNLKTQAGPIQYQTPKAYLPKSRRAFFPSGEDAGDEH